MKLKGTNVTGRDRGTRKANGQWPMCPGLLSYLGFNVMGASSLLLVLLLTPGEGGGGVSECSGFPWDFHKTQPYQVSIRSKTRHLFHKLL